MTRKGNPVDPSITSRSNPIARIPIGKGVYVTPERLGKNPVSYCTERGALKVYSDGSGDTAVPPEWREQGVTVRPSPLRGAIQPGVTKYDTAAGDHLSEESQG